MCRAGDAILGLICLIVLTGLQQLKNHIPRVYQMESLSVRISRLIVWATATGLSVLSCMLVFSSTLTVLNCIAVVVAVPGTDWLCWYDGSECSVGQGIKQSEVQLL